MSFLKNVSIHDKLNRIIMLTTSVALLFAALGFCLLDLLDVSQYRSARACKCRRNNRAHSSTVSLQFQDPTSGRETLETLSVNPHVISAGLYTQEDKIFASYYRDRKKQNRLAVTTTTSGQLF